MWTRSELKSNAKTTFKANYWPCVLVSFIILICAGSSGGFGGGSNSRHSSDNFSNLGSMDETKIAAIIAIIVGAILFAFVVVMLLKIFVGNIFTVGARRFYIENQLKKASVKNLIFSFQNGRYMNTLLAMFFKNLFIGLWSLLFIIPGVIKSYSYFMVEYIIAENPNINRDRAFEISMKTMDGQKWDTFVLDLSFIGWGILSCFTCGILSIFYVSPYIDSTKAQLYLTLRNKAIDSGIATTEELIGINC